MTDSLDLEIAEWMSDHRSAAVTRVCRLLEDVGESTEFFVVLAVAGLAAVAILKLWSDLPCLAAALFVTVAVSGTMKGRIDRPRPPADLALTTLHGAAMPSSHAVITSSVLIAVVMIPPWTSRRARLLVMVAGAVGCFAAGAAMVYLGGHWLSDVLVGWALGIVLTGGTMLLCRRLPLPGGRKVRGTMPYAPHRPPPVRDDDG